MRSSSSSSSSPGLFLDALLMQPPPPPPPPVYDEDAVSAMEVLQQQQQEPEELDFEALVSNKTRGFPLFLLSTFVCLNLMPERILVVSPAFSQLPWILIDGGVSGKEI